MNWNSFKSYFFSVFLDLKFHFKFKLLNCFNFKDCNERLNEQSSEILPNRPKQDDMASDGPRVVPDFDPVSHGLDAGFRLTGLSGLKG